MCVSNIICIFLFESKAHSAVLCYAEIIHDLACFVASNPCLLALNRILQKNPLNLASNLLWAFHQF